MDWVFLCGLILWSVVSISSIDGEAGHICTNRLNNCYSFPSSRCRGKNQVWAKQNCEQRCGLCDINIDTPKATTKKPIYTKDVGCVPEIDLTCDPTDFRPQPDKFPSSKGLQRNSCTDKLNNCYEYDVSKCRDEYEPWALKNCQRRCGLCDRVVVEPPKPTKRGCNDKGVMRSYGQRWAERNSAGQTLTCTCYDTGKVGCSAEPVKGCNDAGTLMPYGKKWLEIKRSGAQYLCTCLNTGRIDCVFNKAGESECRDYSNNCGNWARTGECYANPGYMLVNCRRSCGRC